jgi:hypothetical protein
MFFWYLLLFLLVLFDSGEANHDLDFVYNFYEELNGELHRVTEKTCWKAFRAIMFRLCDSTRKMISQSDRKEANGMAGDIVFPITLLEESRARVNGCIDVISDILDYSDVSEIRLFCNVILDMANKASTTDGQKCLLATGEEVFGKIERFCEK